MLSSKTSERAKVRKSLIDKAITDGVDPSYPRGSSNFALPLGGGKRALLVRADNTFTKEEEYWSAKTGRALPEARGRVAEPGATSPNHARLSPAGPAPQNLQAQAKFKPNTTYIFSCLQAPSSSQI